MPIKASFKKPALDFFTYNLSKEAKRLVLPKGITYQAQEAKEHKAPYNATAGVAYEKGKPFILPSLFQALKNLAPQEIVEYAPIGGNPILRQLWQEDLLRKNPLLKEKLISLPVVTAGLTHGISLAFRLFAEPGLLCLCPWPAWENYELIAKQKHNCLFSYFPLFDKTDKLNLLTLEKRLAQAKAQKQSRFILILNFPHNPTGYSLTLAEADQLIQLLKVWAKKGLKPIILLDDAYFGLFYEDSLCKQSLFSLLLDIPNLIALKIDGPTKEYCAWGLRIGFLTIGSASLRKTDLKLFEEKVLALVRTSVSSCSQLAQSLLIKTLTSPSLLKEQQTLFSKLQRRYQLTREYLKPDFLNNLNPYPFNSGYFLTFRFKQKIAYNLRSYLLKEKGIGTVALAANLLRVTYAAVDDSKLKPLFNELQSATNFFKRPKERNKNYEL